MHDGAGRAELLRSGSGIDRDRCDEGSGAAEARRRSGRLRGRLARSYVEWGFSAFNRRRLFDAGAVIGEARVQNGDARSVSLVARGPVAVTLVAGRTGPLQATIRYDGPLKAPLAAGDQVAILEVTAKGMAPARIPLFAGEAVATAGPLDRIVNAIAGLFT